MCKQKSPRNPNPEKNMMKNCPRGRFWSSEDDEDILLNLKNALPSGGFGTADEPKTRATEIQILIWMKFILI